ncbi:MAG: DUF1203 domain-containing protein [Thermoanaerobaculia bacterium]|jgi:hypothetical protein
MPGTFRLIALPYDQFGPLFGVSDDDLEEMMARRVVVDEKPGFPCRVSLEDAEIGETVLLLPFLHHDVLSPYRASGPVFVRQGVKRATPAPGEIPAMFRHRLLSIRAYDDAAMMIGADVVEGSELEASIMSCFASAEVSYLHVHNAKPGCYNCRVERA